MSAAVDLADYFRDAPFYREHRGMEGACFYVKDLHDDYAPGLWIAREAQRLEIATVRAFEGDVEVVDVQDLEPRTVERARRRYDFRTIDVKPGDAVIDYYVSARDVEHNAPSWDKPHERYSALRASGALVQFHVPEDVFRSEYEFVDAERSQRYVKKAFQIKFADEDAFVRMPDGAVEHVAGRSEAFLVGNRFTMNAIGVFAGHYERMIAGQALGEVLSSAIEVVGKPTLDHAMLILSSGSVGLSFHSDSRRPGRVFNPYAALREIYQQAKGIFDRAELMPQQRTDFMAHYQDIETRHRYFDRYPLKL